MQRRKSSSPKLREPPVNWEKRKARSTPSVGYWCRQKYGMPCKRLEIPPHFLQYGYPNGRRKAISPELRPFYELSELNL